MYTSIVYLLSFWLPPAIKGGFLALLAAPYILHEWNGIRLKVPQNRWQVPHTWVSGPPMRNMAVWGLILGAGLFTYIPHITFHLLYLYLGFFKDPAHGLLFGALYGFSRAIPTAFFGMSGSQWFPGLIPRMRRAGRLVNGFVLILLVVYLVFRVFASG
ncbi:MAG: hypothetical protein CW342_11845 [Thermoactinomycetaceae bacterium]|uniref:hypothetical protein n=1 Tax=Planifilum fulgidum TaxID=201973 RepID=UPI000B885CD9|nr:hypothetical protein [Planifilum fulgidum]MBO2497245.1 hypothetical protein [Bacillota bacterium]MBO2533555.1 hypothetical protein [Thermoactinomycetaceae bacterium]